MYSPIQSQAPQSKRSFAFSANTKLLCSLSDCASKIFTSPGSGARSTNLHRRLHAACLVFTSSPG
jgi:hypothetical protein